MLREVRLSAKAEGDQDAIWLHIAQDNIGAADRMLSRFSDVFRLLAENPNAGISKPQLGKTVRTFTVEGHVICYRVAPASIDIVAIFHGARKITRRLLE